MGISVHKGDVARGVEVGGGEIWIQVGALCQRVPEEDARDGVRD